MNAKGLIVDIIYEVPLDHIFIFKNKTECPYVQIVKHILEAYANKNRFLQMKRRNDPFFSHKK